MFSRIFSRYQLTFLTIVVSPPPPHGKVSPRRRLFPLTLNPIYLVATDDTRNFFSISVFILKWCPKVV